MNVLIVSLVAVVALASGHSLPPQTYLPQPQPQPQPQQGSWTEWGMWSHCSATCGMGYQTRIRHCRQSQGNQGGSLESILPLLLLGGSGGSSSALLPLLLGGGMGSSQGGMNPLLLMSLLGGSSSSSSNDTSSTDSTLPLMMMLMGQGGNGGGMDPLTMMLLLGSGSSSTSSTNSTDSSSAIDPTLLLLLSGGLSGQGDQQGGQGAYCFGSSMMKKDCRVAECATLPPMTIATRPPMDCLSQWGPWGRCSVTCGNGYMTRSRACRCNNYQNQHHGHGCNGPLAETKYCANQACATQSPTAPPTQPPVQDTWGTWTPFSSCQQKSNAGCYKTRTRTCKYGQTCKGPFEHSIHCECENHDACHVQVNDRKDCGSPGIAKEYCEQMGCCYDDSVVGVWCFYKQE